MPGLIMKTKRENNMGEVKEEAERIHGTEGGIGVLESKNCEKKAGLKQAKLLDKQQEQRGMGGGITDTRLLHRNAFLLMPKMMMPRALDEPSKPVYLHCNLNYASYSNSVTDVGSIVEIQETHQGSGFGVLWPTPISTIPSCPLPFTAGIQRGELRRRKRENP
ncbi:uncharacterized protein CLUP02_14747 [Colletotrichum lupini]|uniref:Uncharacterized protein n=1 Tax=Colletotrichum lupini TaxID=145971 RepID=A0A9Q8T4L8_9PEZI|nr:uncharacterized protein CLUP02_14747 [Colletotrichum lupini]UQC89219.1 hypothetical protein CLUP02_14747 [Colletotrichum lupini]